MKANKTRNFRMRPDLEVTDLVMVSAEGVYTPNVLSKSAQVVDSAILTGFSKCESAQTFDSAMVRAGSNFVW